MIKVKVPLFSIRIILFISFILVAALSLTLGIMVGSERLGSISENSLRQNINISGIIPAVVSKDKTALKTALKKFSLKEKLASLHVFKNKAREPVFYKNINKKSKSDITKGLADDVWKPFMHDKLIKDESGKYLFIIPVKVKNAEYAVLFQFNTKKRQMSLNKLKEGMSVLLSKMSRAGLDLLFSFLLLLLLSLTVILFSTAIFLVKPVRQFASMIDFLDKPGFKYKKRKNFLSGIFTKSVELVKKIENKKDEKIGTNLDAILSLKNGFDLKGCNAGAFFLNLSADRCFYYDVYDINPEKSAVFFAQIPNPADESFLNLAKLSWAAKAFSRAFMDADPARVISEINNLMFTDNNNDSINMFFGYLLINEKTITFSQSGDFSLYKFKNDEPKFYNLSIPSIGILGPDEFNDRLTIASLKLEDDDTLAIFSADMTKIKHFNWEDDVRDAFMPADKSLAEKIIELRILLEKKNQDNPLRSNIAGLFFKV